MAENRPEDWPAQLTTRSLSVVVVSDCNADELAATVERLHRAVIVTTEDFEILIIDDGSTDNTASVAQDLAAIFSGVRAIRRDRRSGAGSCFALGCKEARSNFVVYVPGDNTWPYRSYVELFGNIGKADIVASYSSNLLTSMTPWRRIVSLTYTSILNAVFRLDLHYYNGLAVYPTSFFRSTRLTATGFGFQAEALIRALSAGYSFVEVALPVDDTTAMKSRSVTPRNVVDALAMVGRFGLQFYFTPALPRAPRVSRSPVKTGPPVDELHLDAVSSRSRSLKPPQPLRIAITGASSGIGEMLARALGEDGHHLFICARRADRLAEVVREIATARAIPCDVTDEGQVIAFAAAIATEVGGLDALINCAGAFGEIGLATSTESSGWWNTIHLNLFGPYLTIKHCMPLLEKGRKARIINLAGGGAFGPFPNYSAYACSKAALVRLTECLAVELQPRNIRVNAISPGIVATDIHKATLDAGEERAGRLQYRRTFSIMSDGGPSLDGLIECVRAMLSPSFDRLTGKTISSNFDPWQTESFLAHIDDITASDLYTLRRLNVANLNEGYLRKMLSQAWANFGSRT